MLSAYGPQERRRGLDAIRAALDSLDDYQRRVTADFADVAALRSMTPEQIAARIDRQRREAAPHGRCPHCGEPLTLEPDSVQRVGVHTWIDRGGLGCEECGLACERGAA